MALAPATPCAACGAALAGPYCAACGQRRLEGRHTLRELTVGAVARMLDLDRGLVHTARRLTTAPGTVVRDYLRGRTVPYTHPFTYLLIAFAVAALSARALGATGDSDVRFFVGFLVPFLAAASRAVFRRDGLAYAEHLILNAYLFAHAVLLVAATQVALVAVPLRVRPAAALVLLGLGGAYLAWGYTRVFARRPLRAAAGAVASLALGIATWGAAGLALLHLVRSLR